MKKRNYDKQQLLVKVTADKNIFEKVPCEVSIPKDENKPVYIDLFLQLDQYKTILRTFDLIVSGKQVGNYIPTCEVTAKKLLHTQGDAKEIIRGEEIKEYRKRFEVLDLKYKLFFPNEGKNKNEIIYTFYFDPEIDNLHLGPVFLPDISSEYLEKKLISTKNLDITLPNGKIAILKTQNIIECVIRKTDKNIHPSKEFFQYINDILVVISFSSRKRLSCYKWILWEIDNTNTTNFKATYPPSKDKNFKYKNPSMLFFKPDIIKGACEKFLTNPYKEYISRAIHLLMPIHQIDIDTEYIKLFTIVEILAKKCHPNAHLGKTLKEKYNQLHKFHGFNLQDLWQMFGNKGEVSLYTIRNKITHGELINNSDYPSIIVALQHLRWSIERIIAKIIEIDLMQTDISPAVLANFLSNQKWRNLQTSLFK